MKFYDYKCLILSDHYRLQGNINWVEVIRNILFGEAYPYIFWMRTCTYLRGRWLLKYTIYPIAKLILCHLKYKLGISIPINTEIKSGFYIGHFGGIVISPNSIIGKNCNISPGVTIGETFRGSKKGAPILGDNIYIGPGAKIIGAVKIGNNVAVGANCVVTKDVPDNAVVIGVPAKIVSYLGSAGYVVRTDYDNVIR